MSEPQALAEVPEEVHQPKLHQQISEFLTERVFGLSNVRFDIPKNYGILVPETGQSLIQIGDVLQGVGRRYALTSRFHLF